ncbi:MAG: diacylglycerol kinase family protein [Polyangiaceae bacterium]
MQALILNPNAARLRRDPALLRRLTEIAQGRARVFVTDTLGELTNAVQALHRDGVERLLLCGGDGTFMEGVSALARVGGLVRQHPARRLTLAFLPAGTVATVARAFEQPEDPLSGLEHALRPEAEFVSRPSLAITSSSGDELRERVGFIFGTGLVARFFERYYLEGATGLAAAARIVARTLVGSFREDDYSRSILSPLPCRVAVDEGPLDAEAFSLVLCSVIRDAGLGMQVCYRAGEDWQRPHVVASALGPRQLGPQVHRVLRGMPLKGRGGFDGLSSQLLLQFPRGKGPWVLDGDLLEAERVQVQAGPALWLLAPRRR